MKIGIITLPLLNNYGGNLQNLALQSALTKLGHNPMTIDFLRIPTQSLLIYMCSWLKTLLSILIGKRRAFYRYSHKGVRKSVFQDFLTRYVCKTNKCYKYKAKQLNDFDAIIVGSDQVWRPKYNYRVTNMFLDFCRKRKKIKRIAYAASFGVEDWEYSPKQTVECSRLAQKFNAVSVREESGIKLCKEYLGVDATWVLDPTLLLTMDDYLPFCKEVPVNSEKYLAVYVLDESNQVIDSYKKEAAMRGLVVKKFHANAKSTLTVPEWLAMFRDASYVVTDSFHGTVFSIIFGKEFKCVYNEGRGVARFESLLKLYNSGRLDEMREFSLNWLKKQLES